MAYHNIVVRHNLNELCPACTGCVDSRARKHTGILKLKKGKFGEFLGCNRYPDCKFTSKVYETKKSIGTNQYSYNK